MPEIIRYSSDSSRRVNLIYPDNEEHIQMADLVKLGVPVNPDSLIQDRKSTVRVYILPDGEKVYDGEHPNGYPTITGVTTRRYFDITIPERRLSELGYEGLGIREITPSDYRMAINQIK